MKRLIITTLTCLCLLSGVYAQEQSAPDSIVKKEKQHREANKFLKKFTFSGYIQAQYQWGQKDATLNVGSPNNDNENSFGRIGIRRGRIKLTFEEKLATAAFQVDITEMGISLKEAYMNIKDPWIGTNSITLGVFNRPFGEEIKYSSALRESPEHSIIFRTLFPAESDLGAMLTLQAPKTASWHFLKLEAGIFSGNGIMSQKYSRMDFIGQLSAEKKWENIEVKGGVSYYNGGVYQWRTVYTMDGKGFYANNDDANYGKFAKREYFGFNGLFGITSVLGKTCLKGEYIFGTQPGDYSSSVSGGYILRELFIRNFSGLYVSLAQGLGNLPVTAIIKYEFYDPNTKIAGNDIGVNFTGKGDIAYNSYGFGLVWDIYSYLRLQTYYQINRNETSDNLSGYKEDREDDVFTFRLQYKF